MSSSPKVLPSVGVGARRKRRSARGLIPYVLIGPSFVGVLVFLFIPAVAVFVLSLFKWNILTPPTFVGLANFTTLFQDQMVLQAMATTGYYVLLNIPVQTMLAILLAVLLNHKLRGMSLFRTLIVMPWLASPVAIATVWNLLFDPQNGTLNAILHVFGIPPQAWLASTTEALPSVAMVNIWQWTGYNMLFFLAGLQSIPSYLYEAANLDGASKARQFFNITLPLLRPTLAFVLITTVIGSFQVFDTVYVMTSGGPGTATNVYNYMIFNEGFKYFHMGYAAAMSVILFVVILIITLLQLRFFSSRTVYDLS